MLKITQNQCKIVRNRDVKVQILQFQALVSGYSFINSSGSDKNNCIMMKEVIMMTDGIEEMIPGIAAPDHPEM